MSDPGLRDKSRRTRLKNLVEPGPTKPREQLPPTGRAGRNLPAAITVGVILGALVVGLLYFHPPSLLLLIGVLVVGALYELAGAVARVNIRIALPPLWFGAIGILTYAYMWGLQAMFMAFYLTIAAAVLWRLVDRSSGVLADCAASIFAAAYIPLLAGFVALMLRNDNGELAVVTFILCTVANDTGGYIAGVLFGKHPMAPSISPKKSWEGFAGSLVGTTACATTMMFFMSAGLWWGPILGVATAFAATFGDLAESLLKRDLGLKDMGFIMPGHGGVMDRMDSLLVTAPITYLAFALALEW